MSALEAFYSTWSSARETFGQGTPQDGTQYDASSSFQRLQQNVQAAGPGSNWQGPASEAYGAKNAEHAEVYGKLGDLDKRLSTEITNAAQVVTTGRQNLDSVKSWVTSMVDSIPEGLSDTDRETKLMQIANAGISKVSEIMNDSHTAMSDIGSRVSPIKSEFDALGNPKESPGTEELGNDTDGDGDEEATEEDASEEESDEEVRQRAERDVQDALAGDQEAAARVDEVLSDITPGEDLTSRTGVISESDAGPTRGHVA